MKMFWLDNEWSCYVVLAENVTQAIEKLEALDVELLNPVEEVDPELTYSTASATGIQFVY